ncbi:MULTISPECIES: pyruvate dehydrogenase (acetyl-transferring), homodimeric type [unclassified Streptomyces]|uniref:pyruvate dehydrogenase (acetyl-transferring), homodimeric type n=1 Tax=unclassified Streptomyces TaxID=2593676 RepID=UPI002DDBCB23|nr:MULTISPECIES: pyruvate dehydrogenase (acetyl-transferring), homodimeric type [unclassified Streptomyces]WSA94977.1 pyruvate dehydrogenase (acetyl-transferring), homodimeric type [Streptomyces sp. NBC_01795]WSB79397.1 pyruvate dehydrogenase (acetyl-transferring), homodimeric type [Streptomyces sp. NBC_01775]WSS12397.1 pyruvate dehydrogenase (acetyl-transferring), homodimeric type [Streptomyces sp. NBC_01186]WSS41110.1 pyruvate dehydrogenase (acetyl-transferring), homodimeric type [Streptomyce
MASGSDRNPIIIGGLPSQVPDFDPEETQEWLDSLDAAVDERGRERARYLMLRLIERAREKRVAVPEMRSTDYVNTIATKDEPFFPGNEEIERKVLNATRWNAAVMVSRAQRPGIGVGGHIATFASSASLYDVGFNHFFRGKDEGDGGDQIFFQGHASPGIYARAFLLDRLSEAQLDGFRQEKSKAPNGLPSYPHPRLMPDFWEFPTVSMGLGPIGAIHQARMNRYMEARGIADTSKSRVWAFLGDGEMDEPESLGQLSLAAREGLDNLTFVINCNLQRLDGPVRGNGKVIQELESYFRGAGWNVIKLVWDRSWDPLLAQDRDGVLVNKLNTTPDGQFQTYATESGDYIREHFFGGDQRLRKMVEGMTDDQLLHLGRGGHDHRKVYATYKAAAEHKGQPTVILAQTIKGWTLGPNFEGRNATHQMKKLTVEDLKGFRDRLHLPIPDSELESGLPPYYHPGRDSEEIQYMHDRRRECGGYVPTRVNRAKTLNLPDDKAYATLKKGSGQQQIATTMAFVRLLKDLMRDKEIGKRFVPIAPDEYRTFGMDSFFPSAKIYNPLGQLYESVDRELLLAYKESPTGQMLHDGISEAGCTAAAIAAGSAYATHGEPLIPIYVFYSMFGFQRTGDQFWQMADQMSRGFVLGATAGRTTLTGEGLQHADGHSQLLASTNPAAVAYDPAYGFEIAHIVQDGLRRMYGSSAEHPQGEDIFYYLTVYNEPIQQPAEPENVDADGILKGLYRYRAGEQGTHSAQILASGVAMAWALEAQRILAEEWDVRADVWSATSWNELRREAVEVEEHNLLHPEEEQRVPYVTRKLQGAEGPKLAVSDWMRSVPDQIARWVPGTYQSLGADGFGFADTRGAARRFFHIDAQSIVLGVLTELAKEGRVDRSALKQAIDRYQLLDASAAHPGAAGGDA